MNVEHELRAAAAALRSEYDDYDLAAAEQRLARLVQADSHPSAGAEPGSWRESAACRENEPDQLFVRGAAQRQAKTVCLSCPVRTECLAEALDNRIEYGVWGGMTERERRALLRRRPDVESWHDILDRARRLVGDHEAWELHVLG